MSKSQGTKNPCGIIRNIYLVSGISFWYFVPDRVSWYIALNTWDLCPLPALMRWQVAWGFWIAHRWGQEDRGTKHINRGLEFSLLSTPPHRLSESPMTNNWINHAYSIKPQQNPYLKRFVELPGWGTYGGAGKLAHLDRTWRPFTSIPMPCPTRLFHLAVWAVFFYNKTRNLVSKCLSEFRERF